MAFEAIVQAKGMRVGHPDDDPSGQRSPRSLSPDLNRQQQQQQQHSEVPARKLSPPAAVMRGEGDMRADRIPPFPAMPSLDGASGQSAMPLCDLPSHAGTDLLVWVSYAPSHGDTGMPVWVSYAPTRVHLATLVLTWGKGAALNDAPARIALGTL
eukprot:453789-Rhodomonas_salina.1